MDKYEEVLIHVRLLCYIASLNVILSRTPVFKWHILECKFMALDFDLIIKIINV